MNFWEKVQRDLQKGLTESIAAVREGAAFVRGKAEELTEEGKKQYSLYNLKSKVQKDILGLGGSVYDLSGKVNNPMSDSKVKATIARIKKLETEINKLEGKATMPPKRTVAKRSPVKKAAPKRQAPSAVKKPS
ncbi:MAG: hypothetical protein ACLPX5_12135 [Dissulfurispiraceae bacterium]